MVEAIGGREPSGPRADDEDVCVGAHRRHPRRECKEPMAVVGDECAGRGADHDRGLRQRPQHREHQRGEHRVARALCGGRHRRVAQRFLALMASRAVEGQRAIEPPGDERRGRKREQPHQQRPWLIADQQRENTKIDGEADRADAEETKGARQALGKRAQRVAPHLDVFGTHTQILHARPTAKAWQDFVNFGLTGLPKSPHFARFIKRNSTLLAETSRHARNHAPAALRTPAWARVVAHRHPASGAALVRHGAGARRHRRCDAACATARLARRAGLVRPHATAHRRRLRVALVAPDRCRTCRHARPVRPVRRIRDGRAADAHRVADAVAPADDRRRRRHRLAHRGTRGGADRLLARGASDCRPSTSSGRAASIITTCRSR